MTPITTPGTGTADWEVASASAELGYESAREELRVFALWKHDLTEAFGLAKKALRQFRDVVIVRSVDGEVLSPQIVHTIEGQGIKVFSVSGRYSGVSEQDAALLEEVGSFIEERAQVEERQAQRVAPTVDSVAAARVAAAYAQLKPATPAQREAFLSDFYGDSQADDGVR